MVLPFDEDDHSSEPHCTEDQLDPANDKQLDSVAIPFDDDLNYGRGFVDNIIVVANPRTDDTLEFPDGSCCMLVSNGKPLLEQQYKDDVWQLFMHKGDNSILFSGVLYLSSL